MNSITSLIPRPRPVKIAALDCTFQVSEFTLNDLADLQSFLDARWDDPLASIEATLPKEGDGRRKALVDAYEAAETGPPIYGEPSGAEWYGTPAGIATLLWVALQRNHPEFTPESAVGLMEVMTPGEYSQIWRITHGAQTLRTLERLLGLGQAKRPGRKATWGQIVDEVCQSHPGWTYADVYGLTITELFNARRGGKPEENGVSVPMDAAVIARMVAEQRARFHGNGEAK